MFNKQIFLNKLGIRFRILLAVLFSFILSFILIILWQPKVNNIPVMPVSLLVKLNQNKDGQLTFKSSSLENIYPQDYQLNSDSNFYKLLLKKGDAVLFAGKTVKSYIIVSDSWDISKITSNNILIPTPMPNEEVLFPIGNLPNDQTMEKEMPLNDFELHLPYFKDATTLIIQDENGNEKLKLDLTTVHLKQPETSMQTCGDGVCSDNENILFCRADCSYMLKNVFKK